MTSFEDIKLKTTHFYRVSIFVSAHGKGGVIGKSYDHDEHFNTGDLHEDRKRSRAYYYHNLLSYPGNFIYPLTIPVDRCYSNMSTYSIIYAG
jgi:hypothetical protein